MLFQGSIGDTMTCQQYPGLQQKRGGSRAREEIVPLFSAFVRPPLGVLHPGLSPSTRSTWSC